MGKHEAILHKGILHGEMLHNEMLYEEKRMHMDFKRIDQDTIQCILSENEMEEYGFQVEDLLSNQEKARGFFEYIMDRAQEELGYQLKNNNLSMQIMRLPNHDLVFTFCDREKTEGMASFLQHIQQLAGMAEEHEEDHIGEDSAVEEKQARDEARVRQKLGYHYIQGDLDEFQEIYDTQKVFCFRSFSDLLHFAKRWTSDKSVTSSVYKDEKDGYYFMYSRKGRLSMKDYARFSQLALDYAEYACTEEYSKEYCQEHYKTVIPRRAVDILKQI